MTGKVEFINIWRRNFEFIEYWEACCQEAAFSCPIWGMLRTENPPVTAVTDAAAPGGAVGITEGSGWSRDAETHLLTSTEQGWGCSPGPCCSAGHSACSSTSLQGSSTAAQHGVQNAAPSTALPITQEQGFCLCTRPGFPKGNKRVWGL